MVTVFLVVMTTLNTLLACVAMWQRHVSISPLLKQRAKEKKKAAKAARKAKKEKAIGEVATA